MMANQHPFVHRTMVTGIGGLLSILSLGANASSFALIEQSVSSMGTAYAQGSSGLDDASTIYFNPAGMTRLPGGQTSAGIHIVHSNVDFAGECTYNPLNPLNQLGGISGSCGSGSNDLSETAGVPNLYISSQYNDRLWLGLGVNAPFGLRTEYPDNWAGRYHAVTSELLTVNINPSLAFKVDDHVSVGAGISVLYADGELTQFADLGLLDQLAEGGLLPGTPDVVPGISLGPGQADTFAKLEGDDFGFGFNFGVMIEASERTRLGLHYRSSVELEVEGTSTVGTNPSAKATLDLSLPDTLSLSAYHAYNNQWALMADITWTQWSRLDALNVESNGALASVTPMKYDTSTRFAIGAIYKYNPTWTLRAGVALDQTPIVSPELRTPRIPGEDRTWLAFGANYQYSKDISFDFGYAHLFVDDPKINNPDAHSPPLATGFHTLTGEYDAAVDILSAQVNWKFN
jgi:long-chain fatty acid transport protein